MSQETQTHTIASVQEHKYRCLVRWVIKFRQKDRAACMKWLDTYKHQDNLKEDILTQWRLGSRGEWGDWR